MAKKGSTAIALANPAAAAPVPAATGRPSALHDTRVVYCGDNLEQLAKLPDHCVDLIYIDPPFNSNRNYEVFWGETKEKRSFEDHLNRARYRIGQRPANFGKCFGVQQATPISLAARNPLPNHSMVKRTAVKHKVAGKAGPEIKHLEWLVESRARNQLSAVRLFKMFEAHGPRLKTNVHAVTANNLVSVCFSLWRAAFLADKTGKRFAVFRDSNLFLEKLITENAVSFALDRTAREWTFNYYMDNAAAGIGRLAETWPTLTPLLYAMKGESLKATTKPQRRWDRCQHAFETAMKNFNMKLDNSK